MKEAYQDISVDRLHEYMARRQESDYVLIDVRQPDEYAQGHIPGSVLIPLAQVSERLHELPVDKDVVVYCRSGHRSKAAALFIASRPYVAATVFNMVGGILAWNGHLLPAVPNLKVFDLEGSDQAVLYRAMDVEKGADRFYTALRERYQSVAWAESLTALAGAEEAHAQLIYQQWATGETDPPSFAAVYAGLAGDIVEGGYTCAALLASLEEQPLEPCRSTLEMALTVEYSAYDLSRNIAHRFQGGPLEKMFNSIAEAEKEHMRLAAQALALCPGQ
ncbi:MAG: rhodanese-like domain-containing protein [Desulfobulbus sp.]|nr:rhodanese-like domain-containing protein [Desulfobulbus sp.]